MKLIKITKLYLWIEFYSQEFERKKEKVLHNIIQN